MHIQIDENSVTLTAFGSLARIAPTNANRRRNKSWTEILRAVFAMFFR
jgi:hypothetical protein